MAISSRSKDRMVRVVGSAFGLGLSPVLPGTCGALLGLLLHGAVILLAPAAVQFNIILLMFILVCVLNNLMTHWAESYWNCEDPGHFVLDEVAGYLFIPVLFRGPASWKWMLIGFLMFRLFDIFKLIPPAKQIDQELKGPWAVLLDDLVSAAYAAFLLYGMDWIGLDALLYS